ncbi:MAG: family 43 glycosylhydrolase [Chloroflexi bacterium]|nr:family 43 glycosylhydrolase [Chloroflexota bacterium]MCC6892262.1 family 43 glycosylhydrolase [Anaerolineae bacterium]
MQYFKPQDPYFVGDCMPFYHDGTFHLYYLQDENHHQAKGGLGGHQWSHASTRDLVHWEHHPMAIPCTEDWEGSICTGSTFYHDGMFYGFYATRMASDRTEKLSLAVSSDGITFEKTLPNPFAEPISGYSPKHYRDPFIFRDETTGEFNMLVTASLDPYLLYGRGGCLARLTSPDLKMWTVAEPFIIPGGREHYANIPECPDYFQWNGWYYLVFSLDGKAHYRMSRQPMGPWLRPAVDIFDDSNVAMVMKTAAFTGNRRIGVAYLACRRDEKDNGERMYAGHTLFREIIQHEDGTLGTKFAPEMVPAYGDKLDLPYSPMTMEVTGSASSIDIRAVEGQAVAALDNVPQNARISLTVKPAANSVEFGLWLRGSGDMERGYPLTVLPYERKVTLNQQSVSCVDGLDQPFTLEIILKDDIIDVCVDGRRCLIDRCYDLNGSRLFFFAQNAEVTFDNIEVAPLV